MAMRVLHPLAKIVLVSGVFALIVMIITSLSSSRVQRTHSQQQDNQGVCLSGLLSRCPVCSGHNDDNCNSQSTFAWCDPLSEACAVTKVWSVRGQLQSVSKGCVSLERCRADRCTSTDHNVHKAGLHHQSCVTCNSEATCRILDFRVKITSLIAGSLLALAIGLYIINAKRRRECTDNCLALCGELQHFNSDSTSSSSLSSRWPRLATNYRYSILTAAAS